MKSLIVLLICCTGSIVFFIKCSLLKTVSGEYFVLSGVKIRKSQRCKKFDKLKVWSFYEPKYHFITEYGVRDFEFSNDVFLGSINHATS